LIEFHGLQPLGQSVSLRKYVGYKIPRTDRDADWLCAVRFCLPDSTKAGVFAPGQVRPDFDVERSSASTGAATGDSGYATNTYT
jgi:hypothetical protein